MFYSLSKQDHWVSKLIPTSGTYVDIGSHDYMVGNNSYALEKLGWDGICIERDSFHNIGYQNRTCLYLNQDAFSVDYHKILHEKFGVTTIDYISIDIDDLSTELLTKLPLKDYIFKIFTIEHDAYLYGDIYQKRQRELLQSWGYRLLHSNVLVEQDGFENRQCPFEDWWIRPEFFTPEILEQQTEKLPPSKII